MDCVGSRRGDSGRRPGIAPSTLTNTGCHSVSALDAIIAGTSLQNAELPIGRLRNTGSIIYRALEQMVVDNFLSRREFDAEFAAARKADQNR